MTELYRKAAAIDRSSKGFFDLIAPYALRFVEKGEMIL